MKRSESSTEPLSALRSVAETTEMHAASSVTVDELIATATDGASAPDEEAASDALASVRESVVPDVVSAPSETRAGKRGRHPKECACDRCAQRRAGSVPVVEPEKKPKTKAEALDALSQAQRDLAAANARLVKAEALQNGEAIARLSTSIAIAGKMACAIAAKKRGKHWTLEDSDAQSFGDAWSVVLAPYADKVAEHVPLITAVMVTAQIVGVRVMEDNRQASELIAAQSRGEAT